jgi:hypothetical protein
MHIKLIKKTTGLIREPEGVDFIIQSKPLTKEEEKALSEFIREYKEEHRSKPIRKSRTTKRTLTR